MGLSFFCLGFGYLACWFGVGVDFVWCFERVW